MKSLNACARPQRTLWLMLSAMAAVFVFAPTQQAWAQG